MSTTDPAATTSDPDSAGSEVPACRRRRWLWGIVGMAILVLVASMLTPLIASRIRHSAELRKVQEEVARIQAAGEPITIEDRYAYFRVPDGVRDITPLWQAAFDALDEKAFREDSRDLPIADNSQPDDLPPDRLVAADELLAKYDAAIQRALAAAKSHGESRFPVKLDELQYDLPHADKLWPIHKLLRLRGRIAVAHEETEKAIESIQAQLAVPRSLAHQLSSTEYLISLSMAGKSLREIDFLVNEVQLSEEQLLQVQKDVQFADLIRSGLVWALIGERGTGYLAFHHPEQVGRQEEDEELAISKIPEVLAAASGELGRPKDCLVYLKFMKEFVAAAKEPFPRALDRREQTEARFNALANTARSGKSNDVELTLNFLPAYTYEFDDAAHTLALLDLTACAIAVRRYELKHGKRPASLAELVPESLNEVPSDPFDGRPLRMVATKYDIVLYSIGKDRRDDGGRQSEEKDEPSDIVIRLRMTEE